MKRIMRLFGATTGMLWAIMASPHPIPEGVPSIERRFFIQNQGQWPAEVLFLAQIGGMDVWITQEGATYDFYRLRPYPTAKTPSTRRAGDEKERRYGHVVRIRLEGGSEHVATEGTKRRNGYYHYFVGPPQRWASFVELYDEVWVHNVYDGVSVRYYYENALVRYDYVVAAGADPSKIRFRIEGTDRYGVTRDGELYFLTRFGKVRHAHLRSYQMIEGREVEVASRFITHPGGTVGIELGAYDPSVPLIIDPLIYSTFIGGASYEDVYDLAVDAHDNAYIVGITYSANYPTVTGSYDTSYNSNGDIFVTKLNSAGNALVYSTFIGGSEDDYGMAIHVDAGGNAYITGFSAYYPGSTPYPTTPGAYNGTHNGGGYDAVVTKLNSTGSALVYSTFLGGTDADWGEEITVDNAGNAYITGSTSSQNFPTTAGAYDGTYNGGTEDIFVTKLNSTGSALVYSTYVGGSNADGGFAIGIDGAANVYGAGYSRSSDYPSTSGAYDPTYNGGDDVVLFKLNPSGSSLVYSTFIGGAGNERPTSLWVGGSGNVYVVGMTASVDYPTTPAAYDTTHNGGDDGFVTKVDNSGSSLVYSTFLGGNAQEEIDAVEVGSSGDAYVSGDTRSADFPTTPGAYDRTHNGYSDVFVAKLDANGASLGYSTFLGGSFSDYAGGLDIDNSGYVYVAGSTHSSDFPTTTGAYDVTHNGLRDAFVTKLGPAYLPVEFAWFRAERVGGDALLTWATASERNSAHFRVEVATEVVDGVPVFRTLGTVKAAGESSELLEYRYVDREPGKRGVRYYRIVEVDYDGRTTVSEVRKLDFGGASLGVLVRPNPVGGVLELVLPSGEGVADVRVEDVRGRVMWEGAIPLGDEVRVHRVSARAWPKGSYVVRVAIGDRVEYVKVVKR